MFIKATGGYNRHGEQFARGQFLLVFSHNSFKWAEETGKHFSGCPHTGRELYACVRHVALTQCGHFMMGQARIAGQSVIVSGAYGSDGLTLDYEKLTLAARGKLVRLPEELEAKFWAGGGHNSAGSEAEAMKAWAIETFSKGKVAA